MTPTSAEPELLLLRRELEIEEEQSRRLEEAIRDILEAAQFPVDPGAALRMVGSIAGVIYLYVEWWRIRPRRPR